MKLSSGFAGNILTDKGNYSYVALHSQNIKLAKELYKKYGAVEYSKNNNFVTIGGITINGITREFMERYINESKGIRQ